MLATKRRRPMMTRGWSPPSAWTRSLIRSDAPTGLTPTGVRETASSTVLRARSRFEFPYRSTAAASASSSVVIRAALARSGSAGTKKRPLIATSATMRRIGSRRRWWEASWASTASSSAWSSSSTSPVDTTIAGGEARCKSKGPRRWRRVADVANPSGRDVPRPPPMARRGTRASVAADEGEATVGRIHSPQGQPTRPRRSLSEAPGATVAFPRPAPLACRRTCQPRSGSTRAHSTTAARAPVARKRPRSSRLRAQP